MDRKKFIRNGILGIASLATATKILESCSKSDNDDDGTDTSADGSCTVSPSETKGPFPIKTPSQLVLENIKSDRIGVALLINLTIENQSKDCAPLEGVLVDVWHCDKDGNYSEYGGTSMQQTDYTSVHFLRGRQTSDTNGEVSFISIFPGWYQGRAPHIHVEVLSASGSSLLVTQIAFPENVASEVYSSTNYASHGQADTSNTSDNVFSDSLSDELGTLTGNLTDGYTLSKTITVKA
ncbi:dioxygenase family protein [Flavobacterium pectinovorum]|uniref:Intradiol ring-cleavage dioxygenase n=1 Tax=Flavobacterium pectinovorum TaxID=29533 RepID=A0AB36P3I0_9FLAO|nr:intradiol ring-cleavage dioxygenase [Flavobacterium pectinovorum]OXB06050.1 intradiol ring-cleavage dioxygenase [Flavobacterium pectinovorum]SHM93400.1 Protocatechuate 3,4-dioxygenase beta subunit [Flavobacterium pectinovorum]